MICNFYDSMLPSWSFEEKKHNIFEKAHVTKYTKSPAL